MTVNVVPMFVEQTTITSDPHHLSQIGQPEEIDIAMLYDHYGRIVYRIDFSFLHDV